MGQFLRASMLLYPTTRLQARLIPQSVTGIPPEISSELIGGREQFAGEHGGQYGEDTGEST